MDKKQWMIEKIGKQIADLTIVMDDVNYDLDESNDEATREVAYTRMEGLKETMKSLTKTARKHRVYDEVFDAATQNDAMTDYITY